MFMMDGCLFSICKAICKRLQKARTFCFHNFKKIVDEVTGQWAQYWWSMPVDGKHSDVESSIQRQRTGRVIEERSDEQGTLIECFLVSN
jgi:hypothetical protein